MSPPSIEATLAALVREAIREEMEPLRAELERLRLSSEDRGVSLDEAAKRLGFSRRTIQRRIKDGQIPAVKVGAAVRIPLSAVLQSEPPRK